jgi:hypothetical protein
MMMSRRRIALGKRKMPHAAGGRRTALTAMAAGAIAEDPGGGVSSVACCDRQSIQTNVFTALGRPKDHQAGSFADLGAVDASSTVVCVCG